MERISRRLNGMVRAGNGTLTMAELDEALFSVDGVLEFLAVLTREGTHDVLDLRVEAAGTARAGLSAAIRAALRQIPACRPDQLQVRLAVEMNGLSPTAAKRTIIDNRPPESTPSLAAD